MAAKNRLGLFDFTMIMVSLVIGMGIFRTPPNVAANSPTPFLFYLAWIAGGFVALCGALTYAEIGSRLPVMGGYYKVFSYAYHPSIAFGINCIILVSNAASGAAVAIVGSEYLTGVLFPGETDIDFIQSIHIGIALAAIILFYGVNMLGLRLSARTQTILMLIKIGLVVSLILPIFFVPEAAASTSVITSTLDPAFKEYIKAFGIGLVAVSFTYGGYQQTINFGSEVDKPAKNIPRGIFMGMIIIITLYMLINYAYVHVIGFEELKTSRNIAAIMASKIFGLHAERILSVLIFFGVLAYINVLLLSNPRVMVAMSEDGILPAAFQRRNRRGALTLALTIFSAVAVLIVFWAGDFDKLLSFSIFLDCFGMALSAGSIFIIRKRTAHLNGTGIFSMKLYPLLPVIFICAYSFVAISLLVNETTLSLTGIAVLAVFISLYFVIKAVQKNNSKLP